MPEAILVLLRHPEEAGLLLDRQHVLQTSWALPASMPWLSTKQSRLPRPVR